MTGAVLHDIGKVKTYKIGKGFEGTNEGKLIGHLILGVGMVQQAIAQIGGNFENNRNMANSLLHLLISHHGIMEWGSPVEPLTIEACILHHADNMDAQVTKFVTVIRNSGNLERGNGWTPYDLGLGKSVFTGNSLKDVHGQKMAEGED